MVCLARAEVHAGDVAEGLFVEQRLHPCRLNSKLSFEGSIELHFMKNKHLAAVVFVLGSAL